MSVIDKISDGISTLILKAATPSTADVGLPTREVPSPAVLNNNRDVGAKAAVKAAATILYSITITNAQAAVAFIQLFNVALAGVTLGTTVPDFEVSIPANSSLTLSWMDRGLNFSTALTVGSTTTEKGATGSAAGVQIFTQTST